MALTTTEAGRIQYRINGHRVRSAADTRHLVDPFLPRFGITRVGHITGLDQLGLHVTSVTRPRSRTIVVFSGKGPSKDQAHVSGVMEAIETYCAERQHFAGDPVTASFRQLGANHRALDPAALILPVGTQFDDGAELDWVLGTDVTTGRRVYVPEDAVFIPSRRPAPLVSPTTNGLCAGNSDAEALLHGLYEVVERDSCSLAEVFRDARRVEPESVPAPDVLAALERARRLGLALRLFSCGTDVGIPTFICAIADEASEDPCFFNVGHGAHLDPLVAATRAVHEAAQSRLLYIGGAREDLWEPRPAHRAGRTYDELLDELGFGFLAAAGGPTFPFRELFPDAAPPVATLEEELAVCLARLRAVGIEEVLTVDLTPPWFPLRVLRVVVPGLECYYSDQSRIGPRIRERLSGVMA